MECQVPGGEFRYTFRLTDSISLAGTDEGWARLGCHLLISTAPTEALREIGENLMEIMNFYTARRPHALPAGEELRLLPTTFVGAFERQGFSAEDE